jgi:hypothetical protein
LAVGLRAIDLFQPCFQTLDRTFAVRGPQEEVASCGCIRPDSGSDHPDGCPTQLAQECRRLARWDNPAARDIAYLIFS